MVLGFTVDPNSPWVVLLVIAASGTAVASFPPLRKLASVLWRRNVAAPAEAWFDQRNAASTEKAIDRKINGSLGRIDTRLEGMARQLVAVQTTQVMNGDRLAEVARKADDAVRKADVGARQVQEFIAEQTALSEAARKGKIERRTRE